MKKSYKKLIKMRLCINTTLFYMMFAVGMSPSLTKDFNHDYTEGAIKGVKLIETDEKEFELMSAEELNELFKACIKEPEPEITYSGMKLSNEYEDQIRQLCEEYDVPLEIMLTIGYQESDGKWDNNGKISETNDYGVFQINKGNHASIYETFGYTSDDLQYDPLKNAEVAVYLVSNMIKNDEDITAEEIFGMYNGWKNWRKKERSLMYVDSCFDILCEYFSGFEFGGYTYVKVK